MSFSSKFPIPFFKHPVSLISALIYDCDLAKRKKSSKVQQGQMALIKTLRRKSLLPKVRLDTPGAQSRSFADVLRIGRSWGCRGYRGAAVLRALFRLCWGETLARVFSCGYCEVFGNNSGVLTSFFFFLVWALSPSIGENTFDGRF